MDGEIQIKMFQSNENVKYERNGREGMPSKSSFLCTSIFTSWSQEVEVGHFFQKMLTWVSLDTKVGR